MIVCWWSLQVLEAQIKADMVEKEMLESCQGKSQEEMREKCGVISDQKAVGPDQHSFSLTPISNTWTLFVIVIIIILLRIQCNGIVPNLEDVCNLTGWLI